MWHLMTTVFILFFIFLMLLSQWIICFFGYFFLFCFFVSSGFFSHVIYISSRYYEANNIMFIVFVIQVIHDSSASGSDWIITHKVMWAENWWAFIEISWRFRLWCRICKASVYSRIKIRFSNKIPNKQVETKNVEFCDIYRLPNPHLAYTFFAKS